MCDLTNLPDEGQFTGRVFCASDFMSSPNGTTIHSMASARDYPGTYFMSLILLNAVIGFVSE